MFLTGALSCWTREYLPWSVHSLFIQSITLPTLTCLPLTEPRRHHIPDYTQSDGEKTCLDHSCWSWHTRSTAHTCCLQWHNHDAITHQPDALSNISKLSVLVTAPEAGCEVRADEKKQLFILCQSESYWDKPTVMLVLGFTFWSLVVFGCNHRLTVSVCSSVLTLRQVRCQVN